MVAITAHDAIHNFKTFVGKPRTELPWLNGTVKGFPNRVHGFYDCALGYSYFSGLRPVIVSCHVLRDFCIHNKTWTTDLHEVQPGDAVIFDWESKKGLGKNTNTDHVGMVISVDLKKQSVTYVSADSTNPCPGLVTVNTISTLWIAGFGRPVKFLEIPQTIPVAHPDQQGQHNAPAPAIPPHDDSADTTRGAGMTTESYPTNPGVTPLV